MERDCAEHENIIVNRVTKIIDEKVEYTVTKKLIPMNRFLIGSILGIAGIMIAILVSNAKSMGKIEHHNLTVEKYIEEQKILNTQLAAKIEEVKLDASEQLNETAVKQLFVIYGLKNIDPTFEIPNQTRGEKERN
jgi:hypothetical protein